MPITALNEQPATSTASTPVIALGVLSRVAAYSAMPQALRVNSRVRSAPASCCRSLTRSLSR